MPVNVKLASGIEISDPLDLITKYYRQDAHDLYDNLEVPQNDEIDLICLASLAFFEKENPDLSDWRDLWQNKSKIDSELCKIPANLSLSDSNIPWNDLQSLFAVFLSCRGFRCPRASKILHKKRPHLIPILDKRRVIDMYYKPVVERGVKIAAADLLRRGHKFPPSFFKQEALGLHYVMLELVKAVREDLVSNLETLKEMQLELENGSIKLTLVRILDIILWENAGEN